MYNVDVKLFGKVAVLMGGNSAEREVSLASGHAVLAALLESGVDAHPFDPSQQPIQELVTQCFSRAFIVLHGRGGEDGVIQGCLQQLGIPYTGSGVLGSGLAMDKVLSKIIWHSNNLPTASYIVVKAQTYDKRHCDNILERLGGKVIVKPSHEGSSIGMSIAESSRQLDNAINDAFKYDNELLIERFINGPEYTVAIINGEAMPSIRMVASDGFYDYEAKYQRNDTQYFCPSGLTDSEEKQLAQLAVTAFSLLNGEGWGRVDVMRDIDGQFLLLESNTVPGMTEKSLVPKAAKQAGIEFTQLVLKILGATLPQKGIDTSSNNMDENGTCKG